MTRNLVWLSLAVAIDGFISIQRFWFYANRIIVLLPFRSWADWAVDPGLFVGAGFSFLGLIAVLLGVASRDARYMVLWNLCCIAILLLPLATALSGIGSRSNSDLERLLMAALILATAAGWASRQRTPRAAKAATARVQTRSLQN